MSISARIPCVWWRTNPTRGHQLRHSTKKLFAAWGGGWRRPACFLKTGSRKHSLRFIDFAFSATQCASATFAASPLRQFATQRTRPQFLSLAERAIGCKIELLSGQQEARLSALGVVSSIHRADGVVGDLGGGSLELTEVKGGQAGYGLTLPLGGLSLMDLSERSPKKAAKIVRETLSKVKLLMGLTGAHSTRSAERGEPSRACICVSGSIR